MNGTTNLFRLYALEAWTGRIYLLFPSIIAYCYFKQDFTNQVLRNARAVKQILVPNYPTDQIKGEKLWTYIWNQRMATHSLLSEDQDQVTAV
jgi:hypothetical protein